VEKEKRADKEEGWRRKMRMLRRSCRRKKRMRRRAEKEEPKIEGGGEGAESGRIKEKEDERSPSCNSPARSVGARHSSMMTDNFVHQLSALRLGANVFRLF